MKKTFLLKTMLLLCALVVGGGAWAQSDYSATHESSSSFSGITGSYVTIGTTNYSAVKKGTSTAAGSITLTVPKNTKYLHLHAAAWNGETVSLSISPNTYSSTTTISLTADGNIKGSVTTYDIDDDKCTSDYYKVITFTSALSANTDLTFTATGGKRFVMWGVNAEAASSDPSSNATFTNKTPSINYPATKTYSQAPQTASGYTGTISYSMTANTAGASINSSTGVVTVTKGGSVTVKAIAAAVPGSFSGSEDSYTLDVNDTRTSAGLAWSSATANVTYGADNNVFPTLTNTHNVSVTYSSSNQAAATIDGNGVITLKDITADTDISAIFAGNDDYLPQTVTYTLKVTKAPFSIRDGVFDFVEAASANVNYGSGISTTNDGQHYETSNATWTAGNVTMVTSGKYRWWSSNNGCDLRFYSNDPYSSATFSVPEGYVITKIVTTGGNFVSANNGNLSSSTWKGASRSVKLSISTSTVTIKTITVTYTTATQSATVQSYGWATYIPLYNVEFAANTAYVVTDASVTDGLTLAAVTTVPAGTPLLLKGAGEKTATVIASADAPTTNKLSVCNGTIASGKYPYVLAKDGEGACFKQWTGEASALNGRVVLLLNQAVATRSIYSLDDEMTGVQSVVRETINDNQYYNLSGQRVDHPTKGLYIVNGKKVLIK